MPPTSSLPVAGSSLQEFHLDASDDFEVLTLCTSVVEADLYKSHLDAEEIPCRVDKDAANLYPSLGVAGIRIWVLRSNLEAALELIAAEKVDEELIGTQWKIGGETAENDDESPILRPTEEDDHIAHNAAENSHLNRAVIGSMVGSGFLFFGLPFILYSLWNIREYLKSKKGTGIEARASVAIAFDALWFALTLTFFILR